VRPSRIGRQHGDDDRDLLVVERRLGAGYEPAVLRRGVP
jgi:hypothetical protein